MSRYFFSLSTKLRPLHPQLTVDPTARLSCLVCFASKGVNTPETMFPSWSWREFGKRKCKCARLLAQVAFVTSPQGSHLRYHHANREAAFCRGRKPPRYIGTGGQSPGDAKVNILAFLTTTSGGEGAVHLVVDNANKAKKALHGAGLSYSEADALHVELPNVSGRLGSLRRSWREATSTLRPAIRQQ